MYHKILKKNKGGGSKEEKKRGGMGSVERDKGIKKARECKSGGVELWRKHR